MLCLPLVQPPDRGRVFLLHPTVAPWLVRGRDGCRVALLVGGDEPLAVYLRADPDNEELLVAMQSVGTENGLRRYETLLAWDSGTEPPSS